MAAFDRAPARRVDRGPIAAGAELSAGAVRVVVARREDSRLRVLGAASAAVPAGAIAGGLVVDRASVTAAIGSALTTAEGRERATRTYVAIDGDEIRTYHSAVAFERDNASEQIDGSEIARAVREAREESARTAQLAAGEDPALRGIVTTQLDQAIAAYVLDGRVLPSVAGFHGRSLTVFADVTVAPLMNSGAVSAVLDGARRRGTVTSGAYALARLLVASGFTEGGVLRLGADLTAYALVRDGRVVGTRVFGIGRDTLLARQGEREDDARVWARCVLSPHEAVEGQFPSRWALVGVPEALIGLPRALGDALAEQGGGRADITALKVATASRITTDLQLSADHLVAAGAAALAADLY